jgi:hypothetical protein
LVEALALLHVESAAVVEVAAAAAVVVVFEAEAGEAAFAVPSAWLPRKWQESSSE